MISNPIEKNNLLLSHLLVYIGNDVGELFSSGWIFVDIVTMKNNKEVHH